MYVLLRYTLIRYIKKMEYTITCKVRISKLFDISTKSTFLLQVFILFQYSKQNSNENLYMYMRNTHAKTVQDCCIGLKDSPILPQTAVTGRVQAHVLCYFLKQKNKYLK